MKDSPDYPERRAHDSTTTTFTTFLEHSRGRTHFRTHSESPNKDRSRAKSPFVPSSAERKARKRPTPLNLQDARKYGEEVSNRKGNQVVHLPLITPPHAQHRQVRDDGSSSVYTDNSPFDGPTPLSPLRIDKRINVLQSYNDWRGMRSPQAQGPAAQLKSPIEFRPSRSKSVNQATDQLDTLPATAYEPPPIPSTSNGAQKALVKSATVHDLKGDQQQPQTAQTDQFTPLTPWLLDTEHKRKASKTLFGNNGWLNDTDEVKKMDNQVQKPSSFFHGIKKKAREFVSTYLQYSSDSRPHQARYPR